MKMINKQGTEEKAGSDETGRSQNPEPTSQPVHDGETGEGPAPESNEAGAAAKKARKKQSPTDQPAPIEIEIEIDKIEVDDSIHPRDHVDRAAVRDYRKSMEDGDKFPPIHVFRRGGKYVVADGRHRLLAAKAAGFKTILAIIHDGDCDAAMLFAVEAVANDGVRRTNADKRKSVSMLLSNAQWNGWNDSEIARRCRVSADLAKEVRAEMRGTHPQETGDDGARLVRRGSSVYPQKAPRSKGGRVSAKAVNSALANLSRVADPGAALEKLLGDVMAGGGDVWLEPVAVRRGSNKAAALRLVWLNAMSEESASVDDGGWSHEAAALAENAVKTAEKLGLNGRLHVLLHAGALDASDRDRLVGLGDAVVVLGDTAAKPAGGAGKPDGKKEAASGDAE